MTSAPRAGTSVMLRSRARSSSQRAGREPVAADVRGRGEPAGDVADHRADPQGLADHGVQIRAAGGLALELGQQAVHRPGMADEPLDRPRERGRRGLVAGQQQRHQLVAQRSAVERAALLVAGPEQQRQHVVARRGVGVGAALCDLRVDKLVHPVPPARQHAPRRQRAEVAGEGRHHQQRAPADVQQPDERPVEVRPALRRVDPEHRPQDHLERDRLEARAQPEGAVERPPRQLLARRLLHRLLVRAHLRPLEGGQQQLALAHVLVPVE
jgi:hypothetical protein